MDKCLACNSVLSKRNSKFCNNKCQSNLKFQEYIDKWKKGEVSGLRAKYHLSKHIRRYLLEKTNFSCQNCGWNKINAITKISPLEIHHKDGDSFNNKEENLEVLCPNCHSLTHNYKSLNKNSSRAYRNSEVIINRKISS